MYNGNSLLINRFFSQNTIKEIINGNNNSTYLATINRFVDDACSKTNEECISEIYQYLRKEYQNEYYYKNTLLNKLLLGIHSPKTTTALTELPVCNSKADFVLINGKAVVYEIKTDLDNLERLDGQIDDYFKAFTRVVVVTSENNYELVKHKLINKPVGICLLTKKGTLSIKKEPIEYKDCLSKEVMFKVLRKNEYEKILIDYYDYLPDVTQFEYFRACQNKFESIPTEVAYDAFIKTLKSRSKIDIEEYSKIPYELKFIVYFSNFKKKDYIVLNNFLMKEEG